MKWRPGIRTAVGTPVAAAWAVAWSFTSLSGLVIALTTFSIGMGIGNLAGSLRDWRRKRADAWDDIVGADADSKEVNLGSEVTFHLGDKSWHDGVGWYYTIDDLPDEGACGAFESRHVAVQHANACGFTVRP